MQKEGLGESCQELGSGEGRILERESSFGVWRVEES